MSTATLKQTLYSFCPRAVRPYWDRVEASALGYRMAKGAFWSLAGAILSRSLMLPAAILVARIVGKECFGELGMIRSTVEMFGQIAGLGLGLTATKYVAQYRHSDPHRAGRILSLSGVVASCTGGSMGLMLLICAPWLARHVLAAPQLGRPLAAGSIILALSAVNGAQTGALAGLEAFRKIARVNLIASLIAFVTLTCGAWVGGLQGAVWALTFNLAVSWTLNHLALRSEAARAAIPLRLAGCTREWPVLWKFSAPAALSSIMFGPVNWLSAAMLVNRPGGYADMGVFAAAQQWYIAVLFIPSVLASVTLPLLSHCRETGEKRSSARLLGFSMTANAAVTLPMVIVGCAASPWIMSIYGRGFSGTWPTLAILLITAGLVSVLQPVGQMVAACGAMWLGFAMNCGWALVLLATEYKLLSWGPLGLATSLLVAYLVHALWTFAFAGYHVRQTLEGAEPCGP